MLYYFKKGNTTERQKIFAVYGEVAVTDRMCQKWFAKFRARDFSPDDAPQSGKPVKADSGQIQTLIENNQHYIMWETANILKISKSIKVLVEVKNMSFILQKKTKQTLWPTQYILSTIYPPHNERYTKTKCKGIEKVISYRWKFFFKSWGSNAYIR